MSQQQMPLAPHRPTVPPIYRSAAGEAAVHAAYSRALAEIPFPHEEKLVGTSFGDAHVLVAGPADGQPLCVWHGFGVTGPCMWRMLRPLVEAGRFRVFVPDQPYQGTFAATCITQPPRHALPAA
jgi:hypothetical protein